VGWMAVGLDGMRKWGMTRAHVPKDVCVSKTFMRQQQEMHGNALGRAPKSGNVCFFKWSRSTEECGRMRRGPKIKVLFCIQDTRPKNYINRTYIEVE